MITFKEFILEVMTQKTAELDFMFGDCASFAVAFQEEVGGEFFVLYQNEKPLHVFVKHDSKNFDVKGSGTLRSMVRSITGSLDTSDWEIKGPFTFEELPCRKSSPKKIEKAREYIKANLKKFV